MKKTVRFFAIITMLIGMLLISNTSSVSAANYVQTSAQYAIRNIVTDKKLCDNSTNMVPQGICFAGDYLLVTAYSNDGKNSYGKEVSRHKSVIYVFKESDKSYVGTILLPLKGNPDSKNGNAGLNHVGGVAYDCSKSGNIWVSVGNSIGCFPYTKLVELSNQVKANPKNKKLVLSKYKKEVALGYQASTMCYDAVNDCLWVAQFKETDSNNSFACSYKVNGKTTTNPTLTRQCKVSVPLQTQGISVRGDKMLITTSYGRTNTSKIYSYKWNQSKKTMTPNKDKNNSYIYTLPPMAEGVVMGPKYAYIIYESVSNAYYGTAKDPVNYIARYDLSKFNL